MGEITYMASKYQMLLLKSFFNLLKTIFDAKPLDSERYAQSTTHLAGRAICLASLGRFTVAINLLLYAHY
ncbi:uncharacterized protein G2W53_005389 [Senna tora]|uniref:Uncharacterized protein n=1 Tax=Senna tora TaxID=362788 RepID=A0A835CJ22_9FABA|nr:uncharacterized protein G2W53_005389 [Senna tora]